MSSRPCRRASARPAQLLLAALALSFGVPLAAAPAGPEPSVLDPLLLSPAELHRYQAPGAGLAIDRQLGHERQSWDAGELTDDWTAAVVTARLIRPATPSLDWSATLSSLSEWDAARDASGTLRHSLIRASVADAEASFKILDAVVLGAGIGARRVETNPGTDAAATVDHPVFKVGFLLKTDASELGIAETIETWSQTTDGEASRSSARELLAHARTEAASGVWVGVQVRQNPLPACCLAFQTTDRLYQLTLATEAGGWVLEAAYGYAPAYVAGTSYDVARHSLLIDAGLSFASVWTATLRLSGTYGADPHASTRIPAALGTTTSADVLETGLSAGLGLARRL